MADLKSTRLIYLKGAMFLLIGLLAGVGVLLDSERPWRTAALLCLAVWAFCRLYYFAFYVIEKYTDPTYRFAGLWSFFQYLLRRKRQG
jgi:hypothetical protein